MVRPLCPDYVPKIDSNLHAFQNVAEYVTYESWLTVDDFEKLRIDRDFIEKLVIPGQVLKAAFKDANPKVLI